MTSPEKLIEMTETALAGYIPQADNYISSVPAMMTYSVDGGGKRIRPLLCLEFCECVGGDAVNALGFACAVEFIHTYSLIHDDLPCMDDDSIRRGKASSHVKFGEANALLAGDALLTHAFSIISSACKEGKVSPEAAVKAVGELSAKAGVSGMIGGQYIDLLYENKKADADVLFSMDRLKTGALIEAACVLGCIAGNADNKAVLHAREFAVNLGLAFQITDDILDVIGDEPSSDEINDKATYVSVFGLNKARELAAEFTDKAIGALDYFGAGADEIRSLAVNLLKREK